MVLKLAFKARTELKKKHWFSYDVNESNVNSNLFKNPIQEFRDPS